MLVGQARTLGYGQFARCVAYWGHLADPEGTDRSAAARHAARRLHLSPTFDGSWALDGLLDPINGAIVAKALGAIEQELFEADWAEAKAREGEGVRMSHLARTPAQRRADALVEMARRSMALPAGSRLPEPLFSVLVGYETFAAGVRAGQPLSGGARRPGAVAGPGVGGAGGLRRPRAHPRRRCPPAHLRRRQSAGGAATGQGVLPPLLRGASGGL
jgi:hypothetical protein